MPTVAASRDKTIVMRQITLLFCLVLSGAAAQSQTSKRILPLLSAEAPSLIDFDSYEKLLGEVKKHRKSHMVKLDSFLALSRRPGVIILDTRSDSMYEAKHIKGAIHLNFSDFTEATLARLIPDKNTRILIYCNNNFSNDRIYFATKSVTSVVFNEPPLTLALNIPTYINLYGYGYKNVYELSETVSVSNPKLSFEGSAVKSAVK